MDVAAGAVIAAHEANPAGVEDLCGDARRELAIGSYPRGFGVNRERAHRATCATREIGDHAARELPEYAGRRERRPSHAAGRVVLADPQCGAPDGAVDIADLGAADAWEPERQAHNREVIDA